MKYAAAMVGNSSSGIIEAASVGLPVVNIGERQAGRLRGDNVIDVEPEASAIAEAVAKAVSADFRKAISGMTNPYGDGQAAPRIVEVLKAAPLDSTCLMKTFVDV